MSQTYLIIGLVLVVLFLAAVNKSNISTSAAPSLALDDPVSDVVLLDTGCRGYAPVGTLSDGGGRLLQLYGRPCQYHRDRWNYHTMVDESRIPVELKFNGRRCEGGSIGCDQAYSGDEMTATEFGTSQPLKVQMYND